MSQINLTDYEEKVKEFARKYGHLISAEPTLDIPFGVKNLRQSLIREEINETLGAMGFIEDQQYAHFKEDDQDLTDIADGIADSIYVLVGTALAYGIPINRIFREVHNSNMTKTAIKAESGQKYGTKTPKGPDYKNPQIHQILSAPHLKTELEESNT
jgi:predicted HAD superfamily Cof-like phosphohydrolase